MKIENLPHSIFFCHIAATLTPPKNPSSYLRRDGTATASAPPSTPPRLCGVQTGSPTNRRSATMWSPASSVNLWKIPSGRTIRSPGVVWMRIHRSAASRTSK
jgi:hypothetical protein